MLWPAELIPHLFSRVFAHSTLPTKVGMLWPAELIPHLFSRLLAHSTLPTKVGMLWPAELIPRKEFVDLLIFWFIDLKSANHQISKSSNYCSPEQTWTADPYIISVVL